MYLSKLQNVHIQMQNICVQMAKCVCPKTGRANNMFETNQLCFLWSEHLSVKAFSYAPLYIWDIETQTWLIQFLPPYKLIREGLKVYHIQKREIYLDFGCNIVSIAALVQMCKHCFLPHHFAVWIPSHLKNVSPEILPEIIYIKMLLIGELTSVKLTFKEKFDLGEQ